MSHDSSPFKFLDSYQQDDREVFFGRKKETQDLYKALSGVKVLLVYGPSGSGKTSLIECGLRNQFSDADWYAITIRRGSDINASVYSGINEALNTKLGLDTITKLPIDPQIEFGQAVEKLFNEKYQPIYLLFDQFEELLISGELEEKRKFFSNLNKLIRNKVPCRILLIMREEFIGHLSEFESLCPSIFQHRFRVEKMGRNNVADVIQQMLTAPKYQSFFTVLEPAQLTEKILSKLPDERKEIELAHVQVFLGELWDRAKANQKSDGLPVLSAALIKADDDLESILQSFLKKQIKELEVSFGEKVPLEVLATMITDRSTKIQISEKELSESLSLKNVTSKKSIIDLLTELEHRRIIRTIKAGDEAQYEISHDVLALVVGQNRTEEMKMREKAGEIYKVYTEGVGLLSQDDIDYLRPFKEYLPYTPQLESLIGTSNKGITRQKRNKFLLIGSIFLAAMIGMIAYTIISRNTQIIALRAEAAAKASDQKSKELLQLVLKGRGEQYVGLSDTAILERLFIEQTYSVGQLIIPRANAVRVGSTKFYDFLIWLDMPSFRWPEIKQVEYRWPCKGFMDSLYLGKEPTLGFGFGYRGWGFCPTIDVKVRLQDGKTIEFPFKVQEYLEKRE